MIKLRIVIDMTIDEAIKRENKIAEENQKIVDTEIVFDDVSLSQLYCDDTEVIEEHLSNYRKCAEYHKQLAEWLKELKVYKSDDFTSGLQTLVYNQGYNKAIDDFVSRLETVSFTKTQWDLIKIIAEQSKIGGKNDNQR